MIGEGFGEGASNLERRIKFAFAATAELFPLPRELTLSQMQTSFTDVMGYVACICCSVHCVLDRIHTIE